MKLVIPIVQKAGDTKNYGTGKHYEDVLVNRNGKQFYQRREVGRKQEQPTQGTPTGTATTPVSAHSAKTLNYVVGDTVMFQSTSGTPLEGEIIAEGGTGVQVKSGGVIYKVPHGEVKKKTKNKEGTIPASEFNANDYKKAFTDPKCTNDAAGIAHVYSLLGADGRPTQANVEKKLNDQAKRMKKGDTQTRNMVDGKYTPERAKMHDAIIKKILSPEKVKACTPKDGEKPKFIMFGGRGGSGKSWFTDKKRAASDGREVMFDSDKYLILDADAIKEQIPEYEGWNAGEVHEESSDIMKQIKSMAMSLGINIIVDGTMNFNPKKPDKVKDEMLAAKKQGYSLEAHYMFSPIQKSCVNAMQRFKTKNGDYSGRLVPTDILLSMQDNEKSFDSVKDIVDDWSFRDNQNFEAKLISRKGI